MKRLIVAALVIAGVLVAPTAANASSGYSGCSTGAGAYTYTRGGYEIAFSRYQGRGMSCSSVRYVINKWLRPKVARQYSWPRVAAPFYDGWVRWHCWKLSRLTVQCDEFTSNTSLRFVARVY